MPQAPAEQKVIVQRMIDAGESEENIATVIKHFKTTDPTDPFVRPRASISQQFIQTGLNTIGEAARAFTHPVRDPVGFVKGVVGLPGDVARSHLDQSQKAFDAFGRGDVAEGALRSVASGVPLVGPLVANYVDSDQAGKEQIAGGIIGGIAQGRVAGMVPRSGQVVPSMRAGMNPNEVRALEAAQTSGVPINAGVATGNRAVSGMLQGAEKTTASGSGYVNRTYNATAQALDDMGSDLARQSNQGARMNLSQAGQATFDALQKKITTQTAAAQRAYSAVEAADQAGTLGKVSFPTVRALLRPVYDHLTALNDSTGGLDAATSVGQTKAYLDVLMKPQVRQGYGYVAGDVPVMAAERILGNLKEALRGQSNQFGATSGQLRTIIKTLQSQIDSAAKVNPAAFEALQDGRLATVHKYQASTVLDKLAGRDRMRSPITATEQLLSDGGVKQLQRLAVQAPETVRDIGRAWFEEKFKNARATPGAIPFDLRTAGREWRQMSDDTKQLAYKDAIQRDPSYLQRVDDFFTAAAKIQENANPSGSAAAAANYFKLALSPTLGLEGIGLAVGQDVTANLFARAMNNPRVVRLLVEGLRIPVPRTAAAMTARAANIAAIQSILHAGLQPPPRGAGSAGQPSGGTGRMTGAGPAGQIGR